METLLTESAKQVPNLAVLTVIVSMFIRFLRESNEAYARRDIEHAAVLADLNKSVSATNENYSRVIEANTIAATRNTIALDNTSRKLEELALARK